VLADAEMQVPAAETAGLEVAGARERQERLVGRAEIRRSTQQPRDVLGQHVEHFPRRVASGDALRIGGKDRKPAIPSGRQLAPLHQVDLGRKLGVFRAVSREQLGPAGAGLCAARADASGEVRAHAVGNQKLGVLGPAVVAFGEADLLLAQRLAVRRGGILLVRRAVADVAVEDDEGGAILGLVKDVQGVPDPLDVVGVAHAQNVPPVSQEAGRDVLGKGLAEIGVLTIGQLAETSPLSLDRRREAAERYGISPSVVVIWVQRFEETGSVAAKPSGGSASPLEQHAEFLLDLIVDQPDLTLDEIVAAMRKRRIAGSHSAVWRFFARRISLKKLCTRRSGSVRT
jgi:transposase